MTATWRVLHGDARDQLATLPERSVQTCVTSPPYFGLRDYGDDGQIGLETTVDEYVTALVDMFRAVRRVLRDDGTVWLNLGDSYNAYNGNRGPAAVRDGVESGQRNAPERGLTDAALKPKDLIGVPWRVAFALQADGWYLRSEIIWSKPNPMPESVTDRPTRAHEQVFLLAKQPRYFWDADAIREPHARLWDQSNGGSLAATEWNTDAQAMGGGRQHGFGSPSLPHPGGRNKRSVWTVATTPYAGAHFATFSPKLVEPCILAGSPERACGECGAPWTRVVERTPMVTREGPGRAGLKGASTGSSSRTAVTGTMLEAPTSRTVGFEPSCDHDDPTGQSTVLDPFAGSGTTGVVALRHNRSFVGVELNGEYVELARRRICDDAPLFNTHAET